MPRRFVIVGLYGHARVPGHTQCPCRVGLAQRSRGCWCYSLLVRVHEAVLEVDEVGVEGGLVAKSCMQTAAACASVGTGPCSLLSLSLFIWFRSAGCQASAACRWPVDVPLADEDIS